MLNVGLANIKELMQWDSFIDQSSNGTLFHKKSFLSYHSKRFDPYEEFVVWKKGGQVFAVMPAAVNVNNGVKSLISPYGASFGGPVFKRPLRLREGLEVVRSLKGYLADNDIDYCRMVLAPSIYSKFICETLQYCLEKDGFLIKSRDVFTVIELAGKTYEQVWSEYEGRARTAVRKSIDMFELKANSSLEEFYSILLEDKQRHNSSKPTHSLADLLKIKELFPDRVWADVATHRATGAKAAVCYFAVTNEVVMTFYMAQETSALKLNGVNVLVDAGIKRAIDYGFKYFDFGGSTVGYNIENIGVANFKESFGAHSTSRYTYEWEARE
ncbi:hypothetical protein MIB92_09060 [Aestuariirhabdus sp. Z084]|uniref:hypothetical protein n=1 Tax=Aestuariirhabdus haliotis TaxID=2918751 RepID=UPI0020BE27BF|nr:hypothetical protein [Aestuariirhabdus haliotis]MCL6415800.1 hypothetical protein [Aestuariirhabdus haliotis]